MSESVNLMPFICKWLDTHSKPQHFETWEKLRNHVDKHDLNSCNRSSLGNPIYICPWKDCNKHQSSIVELEEHLRRHTQQRPFKCPICKGSRFSSPDKLTQHLIIKHNDNIVTDDTLYDENEELNLDKSDVYVKKEANKDEANIFIKGNVNKDEIIPINNTTKLSYRDVLIKGKANENQNTREFLRNEHENAVRDLLSKGMEAISLLPESQVEYYDLENENYDDLPDAPQEELSEAEQEDLMWEAFREAYKGSKAVEYFSKAFEMMKSGP